MDNKNVHYTERERMLLAQLVSEEKAIENKKTGASDLKDKVDAWERITKKFDNEGCTPRSSKQLKKCWDNMKQRKRKLNTTMRHERLMTGGGPPSVQPNDPVMAFMDATNANLDVEIDCPFDSTAVFEKEYNVKMDCASERIVIEDESEKENENIDDICHEDYIHQNILSTSFSTPKEKIAISRNSTSVEKRATSSINNISEKKVTASVNALKGKKATSNIKNIENIRDEKELRLIKIRETIEQQRKLHRKKNKDC
ncbi:uncharacterized protein [Anoplolepis gracilipes]|uniref:uncharacterized protein isoform X1 n=1 Tax=Anoplolepis gracilipes TaxID=354296 RepID=UPI003B9E86B2